MSILREKLCTFKWSGQGHTHQCKLSHRHVVGWHVCRRCNQKVVKE